MLRICKFLCLREVTSIPDIYTENIQEWNKPRGKRVEVIPIQDFEGRKREILGHSKEIPVPKDYDPRPISLHSPDNLQLEKLRTDLLAVNHQACLLHLLCPPIYVIEHDHSYAKAGIATDTLSHPVRIGAVSHCYSDREFLHLCEEAKAALSVSQEERMVIESETRNQSGTSKWHAVRAKRVTGSKCGKILKHKHTVALLKSVMYGQSFTITPKPIQWGRDNEPVACNAFVEYMKSHGHPDLSVYKCGFVMHD